MSSPNIPVAKDSIRTQTWDTLHSSGVAPNSHGTIPNFNEADKQRAADNMVKLAMDLTVWQPTINADSAIMFTPDSVLEPARQHALLANRKMFLFTPGIKGEKPIIYLDPAELSDDAKKSGDIEHMLKLGTPYAINELDHLINEKNALPTINLMVGGSVAVNRFAQRLGKGMSYWDREAKFLLSQQALQPNTEVITIVHSLQVRTEVFEEEPHDIRMTGIATEREAIKIPPEYHKPIGSIIR